jgi:hypothetical protein
MPTETLNTLHVTRRFKAPRHRVFDAFSTFNLHKVGKGTGAIEMRQEVRKYLRHCAATHDEDSVIACSKLAGVILHENDIKEGMDLRLSR